MLSVYVNMICRPYTGIGVSSRRARAFDICCLSYRPTHFPVPSGRL